MLVPIKNMNKRPKTEYTFSLPHLAALHHIPCLEDIWVN